jgi:hypothetical protein
VEEKTGQPQIWWSSTVAKLRLREAEVPTKAEEIQHGGESIPLKRRAVMSERRAS